MKIANLDDIVEAGLCAGCGICESIAGSDTVEMKLSSNGRIRPYSKKLLNASTFDQIMQVCPGVTVKAAEQNTAFPAHPVWGPIGSLHRGWACDEQTRFHAAAGGSLTALGMYLIRTGKVDSILHMVASPQALIGSQCSLPTLAAFVRSSPFPKIRPPATSWVMRPLS